MRPSLALIIDILFIGAFIALLLIAVLQKPIHRIPKFDPRTVLAPAAQ